LRSRLLAPLLIAGTILALAACGTAPPPVTPPPSQSVASTPASLPATAATTVPTTPASTPPATPASPPAGFIGARGTGLVLNGRRFRFTGYDVYNASSRDNCGGTMGYDNAELDQALSTWRTDDGQTVMRVWFFQKLATGSAGNRDWASFDHVLKVAQDHGVKVIPVLGNQLGACEDGRPKLANWYASDYRRDTSGGIVPYRQWVAEVVQHYSDPTIAPTIAFWQLMNEAETRKAGGGCADGGDRILRAFADDVGGLVHQIDHHHLVSLGTMSASQCGTQGDEFVYVHQSPAIDLCEYHDQENADTMPGDAANGLKHRLQQCHDRAVGKPLFIGEVGVHLGLVGDSESRRAHVFQCKLNAAFIGGAVGELAWNWHTESGDLAIGPKDPAAKVLTLSQALPSSPPRNC
jgi:mannan endo-1,4-beta-mannosidase